MGKEQKEEKEEKEQEYNINLYIFIPIVIVIVISISIIIGLYIKDKDTLDMWVVGIIVIINFIIWTIVCLFEAYFKKIKLKKPKIWFDNTKSLGKEKDRLIEHGERMLGTLNFWKNSAEFHNRLVIARVYWGLVSSILIPVLIQFYEKTNFAANIFMTLLTTWTSLITILGYTLKSDEKYRGYRQSESDYYDLARELMDNASDDETELKNQVNQFLDLATKIRKLGRAIETDSVISIQTSKNYL